MTYTIYDAKAETMAMFEDALHCENSTRVYYVATKLAGIPGWEEEAEVLRKQAQRLQAEEWAYDEANNN